MELEDRRFTIKCFNKLKLVSIIASNVSISRFRYFYLVGEDLFMSVDALIDHWKMKIEPDGSGRYIHPSDIDVVESWLRDGRRQTSREAYTPSAASFAEREPRTGRLHLHLRPVPYIGDLKTAKVFLAMINPTVGWSDYEDNAQKNKEYPALLDQNLKQKLPYCFALDNSVPALAPSWSNYYRDVFNGFVQEAGRTIEERAHLRNTLRDTVAILELVPYFSQNATMISQGNLDSKLQSSKLA